MLIGTPKEIKNHEYRVGLTPAGARELKAHGHQVLIQKGAGLGIGLADAAYLAAGAEIVDTAAEIFARAEMIIKVKEPQAAECKMLRPGQVLFTYLHLAPDPEQTQGLIDSGCVAIAYETVTDRSGGLPLLAPMSEVAGRMSIQAGAHAMEKAQGGNGVLMGGVPGVAPAEVLVIGGGVVGYNAARVAVGMGANVTILDRSIPRLNWLDTTFDGRLQTLYSTADALEACIAKADLVIGAVLVPGAAAPKLVTRAMLKLMKPSTVIVDVAIDQGGCFETRRHRPLLRGQHAGRCRPYLDLRAHQRHAAVCARPRQQGLPAGAARRRASVRGLERAPRQSHLQGRGGCAGAPLPECAGRADWLAPHASCGCVGLRPCAG